jgi:spore coat polysaccharide biosynthesis protein SpsF
MNERSTKTVVIVQARMGSTRLPGKVLKALPGGSVLLHTLTRASKIEGIDEVVVATTDSPIDDPLFDNVTNWGYRAFRGSENDVLHRYYQTALQTKAGYIVRITSDCPLLDPQQSSRVIAAFKDSLATNTPADYAANNLVRRLPRGLDTEIVTFEALRMAHREAEQDDEREHVTLNIYRHPEIFNLLEVTYEERDLSHHRWTLDTPEDFQLIEAVYRALYPANPDFGMTDVLKYLDENSDVFEYNRHIKQKYISKDCPAKPT